MSVVMRMCHHKQNALLLSCKLVNCSNGLPNYPEGIVWKELPGSYQDVEWLLSGCGSCFKSNLPARKSVKRLCSCEHGQRLGSQYVALPRREGIYIAAGRDAARHDGAMRRKPSLSEVTVPAPRVT